MGPIPTRDGDVVITYDRSVPTDHVLWTVLDDGQQQPGWILSAVVILRSGRLSARTLAGHMARVTGGAVFYHELTDGTWTRLSHDDVAPAIAPAAAGDLSLVHPSRNPPE